MKKDAFKMTGLGSLAGLALIGGAVVATDVGATETETTVEDSIADAAPVVCADTLAQGDSAAYADVAVADCMFVGCGGIF